MERMQLTEPRQIKAVLHPLRQRIMRALDAGPSTPSEVARRIGLTANKVHYHVKVLEEAGLVRLAETRSVGSVTEKYYELTARDFEVRMQRSTVTTNQTVAVLQEELEHLMSDLQEAMKAGSAEEQSLHVSIHRMEVDHRTTESVRTSVNQLLERVEAAAARRRGQEYRLVLAWVPMRTEGNE